MVIHLSAHMTYWHISIQLMQALLAAPEPDDPQDAVVARQVRLHFWITPICLDRFIIFASLSIRRVLLYTRQQPSTGLTCMLAPSIGYFTGNQRQQFDFYNTPFSTLSMKECWGSYKTWALMRWFENFCLPMSTYLKLKGSGARSPVVLWLGPSESDWNSFQLNVTNEQMWPAWFSYFEWSGCWGR